MLEPTNPPPLAVELVRWMNDPDLAMRFRASAGALLQFAVTLGAIGLWLIGERLVARLGLMAAASGRRGAADRPVRLAAGAAMVLAIAAVLLGLAGLAVWSVAGPWRFPDALPDAGAGWLAPVPRPRSQRRSPPPSPSAASPPPSPSSSPLPAWRMATHRPGWRRPFFARALSAIARAAGRIPLRP
ncbi:MAG: hypothetical protein R3D02_04400 [Hyphomicrobiales bacterium]